MNNDLEDLLKEGSLQDGMIKIAKLLDETTISDTEEAWRPPGDVALHMRSLDADTINKQINELLMQVTELENSNETLMNTIAERRSRICATSDNLTRALDHAPDLLQRLEKLHEQLATCHKA